MSVQIVQMRNGGLALLSDRPFRSEISYIEYYRDQRLLQLVFDSHQMEDYLVTRELDLMSAGAVEKAPDMMVVVMPEDDTSPYGYDVPIIQVGL